MRATILSIFCLLLIGCGSAEAVRPPSNVTASEEFVGFLQHQFDAVKLCTGFETGRFEDLKIIQMPPSWDCPGDIMHKRCSGVFTPPNQVFFGFGPIYPFNHEVIHYLLFVNTGDPDRDHISSLFEECS